MKVQKNSISLLLVAMLALVASCTKNNGDIGMWFGQWRVEKIEIDGTAKEDYAGNLYFSFQNDVFEEKYVTPEHEENNSYGRWTEDADNTLTIYFEDKEYLPIDGYMSQGSNILKFERKSSTSIVLTLKTDEHDVTFHLLKW